MAFIDQILARAKSDPKTIVLPESYEPRNLEAASKILADGVARIILIGDRQAIQAVRPDCDVSAAIVIDPARYERFDEFVEALYERRKHKGMTRELARASLADPQVFGVMLVRMGQADGMVSGAVHSTADTLRPALQILGTAPGTRLVSSFFIMVVPDCQLGDDGMFLFADCGLVEQPDAEQLSEIALASARSYRQLTGRQPVVAMLSYSTKGSARSADVDKVIEATRLAREKDAQLQIDGEFQLDAAIVPSVGKSKAPDSPCAGKANVLIFPDLDAGNIGYKLTQRLARAEAYGPVTQGISKPVNDLSRGCFAEDIVGVIAMTAVQAQEESAR